MTEKNSLFLKNLAEPYGSLASNDLKRSKTSKRLVLQDKCKDLSTTTSVANCIRSLNLKTSDLEEENHSLKLQLTEALKELSQCKLAYSKHEELISSLNTYKEKYAALEQSNDLISKKLSKFEDFSIAHTKLKTEYKETRNQLTKEIEKNNKLILQNNNLRDQMMNLESQIADLTTEVKELSQQRQNGFVGELRLKDSENNNRILEGLVEKQQKELDEKRQIIEGLKRKIMQIEDYVYEKKVNDNKTSESSRQPVNKKDFYRQRASTPSVLLPQGKLGKTMKY